MGRKSKDKGKRGEREVANFLKGYGYDARRGQQYCGSNGDADVVGLPRFHIEVKYVENLNLLGALEQSISDAKANEYPVVFHKKNYQKLQVTMRTQDFIDWTSGHFYLLPDRNYATFPATEFMELYQAVESRWKHELHTGN